MEDRIILGQGSKIVEAPLEQWKHSLADVPQHGQARLSFMTSIHHKVRNFAVTEMVNRQKPIEPSWICEGLNLAPDMVSNILTDLEKQLFFLVRNETGAVAWAYPFTVETTPHSLQFSTGERLYGA